MQLQESQPPLIPSEDYVFFSLMILLTHGHWGRFHNQQCRAGGNIFVYNPEVVASSVTTVNRAVGVQGRLEDI